MKEFNPKHILLETLKKKHQIESLRGSDVVALNSKAILYIRYNKNAGATKNLIGKFWFGITKSEYEKYSNQNLFIVCACVLGTENIDYIVLPSDKFDEIRNEIVLQSGQWKFNLLKTSEKRYLLQISQKGKYDVTDFLNYFDFSPKEFRKIYWPSVGEIQPKIVNQQLKPSLKEHLNLEDELLLTAKDSANPQNFEISLEKFFIEIGFPCRRIGGSGETDILVLEPKRFIVDGKSTKADAKSSINFTRIKRHMKENSAEFMAIISVGFDPAVGRDAKMEGATLIDIQTLVTILRIHKEYVLSPLDYLEVFSQSGIITAQEINMLQPRIESQNNILNKSFILIENLDFTPRNIDEIKGRIDLFCQQNTKAYIEKKEIENLLTFLSHDLLAVIAKEDSKYNLRFTPLLARERLKNTIRMLCSGSTNIKV